MISVGDGFPVPWETPVRFGTGLPSCRIRGVKRRETKRLPYDFIARLRRTGRGGVISVGDGFPVPREKPVRFGTGDPSPTVGHGTGDPSHAVGSWDGKPVPYDWFVFMSHLRGLFSI